MAVAAAVSPKPREAEPAFGGWTNSDWHADVTTNLLPGGSADLHSAQVGSTAGGFGQEHWVGAVIQGHGQLHTKGWSVLAAIRQGLGGLCVFTASCHPLGVGSVPTTRQAYEGLLGVGACSRPGQDCWIPDFAHVCLPACRWEHGAWAGRSTLPPLVDGTRGHGNTASFVAGSNLA